VSLEYKFNEPMLASDLALLFKNSGIRRSYDDHERIQRMINNANEIVTAWDNGKLVGIIRSLTDYSYCCYISELAVDREYQGQGIGNKLLDLLIDRLGRDEIKYILTSSKQAIGFYIRYGFEKDDQAFVIKRRLN
jgi:ribosomal protein S18 acetylase RimI-like enzyme